ncbi:MAG TPA: hypothetical protein VES01_02670 [Dermatophilaceae bacterium]|nr:hypothetical protein [Dermatophilaceae bacterium]
MTTHHDLPTPADYGHLTGDHAAAVTVYLATSPVPVERDRAQVALKSAFDRALRELEDHGVPRPVRMALVGKRDDVLADGELWGALSRSLAVFVTPDLVEVFVLPNKLEDELVVGTHFALSQLWRPMTQLQEAFAITLSANEWRLWHATPTERVRELDPVGDYPQSAAEATNRESAGRGDDRLSGDPYDLYAKRVADAARKELAAIDPTEKLPLFVFADEALGARFASRKEGRELISVRGSSDRLTPAQIDEAIRDQLAELNVAEAQSSVSELKDGDPSVVERDLAAIARMAVKGAIDTYWFDFTVDMPGTLNSETGELAYEDGESMYALGVRDLLSQVAQLVYEHGGRVIAVRGSDLTDPWVGPALAKLRFTLI